MNMQDKIYYSLDELQQMKEDGYCTSTLEKHKNNHKRIHPIIDSLKTAFNDVLLEDGVGLWESTAIDSREMEAKYRSLKAKDERDDWSRILFSELQECQSSLNCTDAKGMRFLLPAFLLMDLEIGDFWQMKYTIVYIFDDRYDLNLSHVNKFALFNRKQKAAVASYLSFRDFDIDQEIVDKSLKEFWSI